MMMNFEGICAIARRIGWGAAAILVEQSRSFEVEQSGDSPVTSADIAANSYILEKLQSVFDPQTFGYLSEETYQSEPAEVRLSRSWVWIIDPLDGTKDFINRTGEYAMHIALAYQGRPVVAIVACPAIGKLYSATLNGGTWVETENGDRHSIKVSNKSNVEDLTVVASHSHRDVRFNQLMEQFPVKQQRQIGSVGCKIAAIVEQQADLYLSLSGKSAAKDWDFAAPELILTEAGGQFTYFDQSPVQYNRADVNQWGGILASNGKIHPHLCETATHLLSKIDQ
ncbi:3'(2'),5'-bisphosphate nucleotidase CysQ [Pseudanabaenaceae cyanobacterium LEGE 13415]|nr:3'(2'),5'-bisphosphate nucleotidase CysQ [Pseudanabaenaceae cyanobacterium LEGE 13415]